MRYSVSQHLKLHLQTCIPDYIFGRFYECRVFATGFKDLPQSGGVLRAMARKIFEMNNRSLLFVFTSPSLNVTLLRGEYGTGALTVPLVWMDPPICMWKVNFSLSTDLHLLAAAGSEPVEALRRTSDCI